VVITSFIIVFFLPPVKAAYPMSYLKYSDWFLILVSGLVWLSTCYTSSCVTYRDKQSSPASTGEEKKGSGLDQVAVLGDFSTESGCRFSRVFISR
jgi:hypothetical protein